MTDVHHVAEELLRKAKDASPGPWKALKYPLQSTPDPRKVVCRSSRHNNMAVVIDGEGQNTWAFHDLPYIACANPEAVTQVCEALQAAEQKNRRLRDELEQAQSYIADLEDEVEHD